MTLRKQVKEEHDKLCNNLPNELKFEILKYLNNNTFIYTFKCLQIKQTINNVLKTTLKHTIELKKKYRYHPSLPPTFERYYNGVDCCRLRYIFYP